MTTDTGADSAGQERVPFSLKGLRVWVAGHTGMVGSALVRRLSDEDCELVTVRRAEVDLRRQAEVEAWMDRVRPDVVFVAAATVGGILANATRPGEFLYDNLAIALNVIETARRTGVRKLLYLGSSCMYPRLAPQPIAEEALLTGPFEPTNEGYALAKCAGTLMCQTYRRHYGCDMITAIPCNLYGPGDNFDLQSSHVLPALIRKMHDAKIQHRTSIELWGTGRPLREFLHVDDLADACVRVMERYSDGMPINIGTGRDLPIGEVAGLVARTVGWSGELIFDAGKPDGTPRKVLDVRRLDALGWRPRIGLPDGLADAYRWFLENRA